MTNTLENVDRTRTLLKYNKSPEARKPIIEKGSYSSVRVVPNGSFDVSRTELLMNIVRARTASVGTWSLTYPSSIRRAAACHESLCHAYASYFKPFQTQNRMLDRADRG